MKTSLLLSGLLSCTLLFSSCRKEEQAVKPVLSLSVSDMLSLQSQESETIIEVSTNMPQWAAVSNAPWLDLRKLAHSLILTSQANTTATTRVAQVVVTSGKLIRTIKIEQAPSGTLALELIPANAAIDKAGGEVRLVVKTQVQDWQAKTTADWLAVLSRPRQGELVLKAEPNETDQTREASIEITSGSLTQTINIKQYGQLKYYEPFNLFGKNLDEINALERKRGSKLIQEPAPRTGNTPTIPDYTYQTLSARFPTVKYEFVDLGNQMLYMTTLVSTPTEKSVIEEADFMTYLQEEGYVLDESLSVARIRRYANAQKKVELYIRIKSVDDPKDKSKKLTQDLLIFRPMVEQPEAKPTLDNLFYGPGYPGTMTLKETMDWEAQNGGHYDQEFSENVIGQPFFFAEAPFYGRLYFKPKDANGKVEEYLFFYLDYQVSFYRFGSMYYPTREFDALLARDGFKRIYYNPESRIYFYSSDEKKLIAICEASPFGPRIMSRIRLFAQPPAQARSMRFVEPETLRDVNFITNTSALPL